MVKKGYAVQYLFEQIGKLTFLLGVFIVKIKLLHSMK